MNITIRSDAVDPKHRNKDAELERVEHGLDHLRQAIRHVEVRISKERGNQQTRVRLHVQLVEGGTLEASVAGRGPTLTVLSAAVERVAKRVRDAREIVQGRTNGRGRRGTRPTRTCGD